MKTAGGGGDDDDDDGGGGGGDDDDDVAVYRNRPLCTSWPCWHWTVRTAGGHRRTAPKRIWPTTSPNSSSRTPLCCWTTSPSTSMK